MIAFFIRRPIFASVLAIVTTLAGVVSLLGLPIAQYPEITPPTVRVAATFPGADAETVSETVGAPIEEAINGVEGMLYMGSTSSSAGAYALTVTFEVGTDLDQAAVRVQNRVSSVEPRLPEAVTRQGVTTTKQSTNITLVVNLVSPDGSRDVGYLTSYASLNILDELRRLDGVGEARLVGGRVLSMRIWLDPARLQARSLTTGDVIAALREQNAQVSAGVIGQPPAPSDQALELSVTTQGRLTEVEEFEEVIVKTGAQGQVVRLRDVARVELGAEDYSARTRLDGADAVTTLVYQLPGANALAVKRRVLDRLDELRPGFPPGVDYRVVYDTTLFVDAAIDEVVETLLIAVLLVVVTILVFLQDLRAALIPAIAIPVSLVSTFAVMAAAGFTLNLVTLFGLVLAIGIVVDDAIVVVENVKRLLDEGLEPRPAAIQAMGEVTGPVIATTLVLLAVFVPAAFLGGITGELFRQFAITLSAATVFSSINALTLSPALCAVFLRPSRGQRGRFERAFDAVFNPARNAYVASVTALLRRSVFAGLAFLAIMAATLWQLGRLPTSFLPDEDQGYVIVAGQLPSAASLDRTDVASNRAAAIARATPGVGHSIEIVGLSLIDGTNSSDAFTIFLPLEPWSERADPGESVGGILRRLNGGFAAEPGFMAFGFAPPAIRGLGLSGGFTLQLQDRAGLGAIELERATGQLIAAANARPDLTAVRTTYAAQVPRLFADLDRVKAMRLGVSTAQVFQTLQTALGSTYINDFTRFGRSYRVTAQAEAAARSSPEDIGQLKVRSRSGAMVPLATLVRVEEEVGPKVVKRFNLFPAAQINGQAAPGVSSGEALERVEGLVAELPPGFGSAWSDVSYQEKAAGGQSVGLLLLAAAFVFLVLAAQYESWLLPMAVLLGVPLGFTGAVLALVMRGYQSDVYVQVGLVLLIALASKNAILIVEFARELARKGRAPIEAALEAARLRLRPILMTSLAFVFGTLPLVIATGAGAASRRALGTAVFGGMISATLLTALFVPLFSALLESLSARRNAPKDPA